MRHENTLSATQRILCVFALSAGTAAIIAGAANPGLAAVDRYCQRLNIWLFVTGIIAIVTLALYAIAACGDWYTGVGRWALMLAIVMTFIGLVPSTIIGVDVTIHAHDTANKCLHSYIVGIIVLVIQFLLLLSFVSWIPGIVDAEEQLAGKSKPQERAQEPAENPEEKVLLQNEWYADAKTVRRRR